MENAVKCADMVLVSGGCSVGIRDYTAEVINALPGEGVFIQGVSIRPGRPLIVGECMGRPVFGLPGHPIAPVLFKIVVEKLWNHIVGCIDQADVVKAVVDFDMRPAVFTIYWYSWKGEGLVRIKAAGPEILHKPVLFPADGYIWIKNPETGLCRGDILKYTYSKGYYRRKVRK